MLGLMVMSGLGEEGFFFFVGQLLVPKFEPSSVSIVLPMMYLQTQTRLAVDLQRSRGSCIRVKCKVPEPALKYIVHCEEQPNLDELNYVQVALSCTQTSIGHDEPRNPPKPATERNERDMKPERKEKGNHPMLQNSSTKTRIMLTHVHIFEMASRRR